MSKKIINLSTFAPIDARPSPISRLQILDPFILDKILSFLNKADLFILQRVNTYLHDVCSNRIYNHLQFQHDKTNLAELSGISASPRRMEYLERIKSLSIIPHDEVFYDSRTNDLYPNTEFSGKVNQKDAESRIGIGGKYGEIMPIPNLEILSFSMNTTFKVPLDIPFLLAQNQVKTWILNDFTDIALPNEISKISAKSIPTSVKTLIVIIEINQYIPATVNYSYREEEGGNDNTSFLALLPDYIHLVIVFNGMDQYVLDDPPSRIIERYRAILNQLTDLIIGTNNRITIVGSSEKMLERGQDFDVNGEEVEDGEWMIDTELRRRVKGRMRSDKKETEDIVQKRLARVRCCEKFELIKENQEWKRFLLQ